MEIMFLSSKKTLILALLIFSALIVQSTLMATARAVPPTVFVNLATDKQTYKVGDPVRISGNVTANGAPVYDALVAVQVNSPNNMPLFLRTAQTGQIANMNWQVNITALYTSDPHGSPANNFTRGGYAYVTMNWTNNGDTPAYVVPALYIEYSTGAPYTACFPQGETPRMIPAHTPETLTTSLPIPSTAPYGTTTIYASIYTNTPKEDGYPYCPEKNATFMIVTPNPTLPPQTQTPPNFSVGFSLYNTAPGGYDVYAVTSYNGVSTSNTLSFPVLPNAFDLDGNGKVDMGDVVIVLGAFGSTPGKPNWNVAADVDGNGRVDMGDVVVVLTHFGEHYP